MNYRTEPTKEQNEAAIRALKRETREQVPQGFFKDARAGLGATGIEYAVWAKLEDGMIVRIGIFPFDDFDGGKYRIAARILAEELADRINEQ